MPGNDTNAPDPGYIRLQISSSDRYTPLKSEEPGW